MTTHRFLLKLISAPTMFAGMSLTFGALSPAEPLPPGVVETYGKLPLSFEANGGQTDQRVKFLSRGRGYTLFLTRDEAVLRFGSRTSESAVRMQLVMSNPKAKAEGQAELLGRVNYFLGNDPAKWRTGIPTYSKVRYEGVYRGVDLVYYGNEGRLEYDFVVAPSADPGRISLAMSGRIKVDHAGDLVVASKAGDVRFKKPVAYQVTDSGEKMLVEAKYALGGANRVRFHVGDYDRARPLVIDPVLSYSTYLGGGGDDERIGMVVDGAGDVFLTGETASTNYPTVNPEQSANKGGYDAFVTKINAGGTSIAYSTYLGGSGFDSAYGIGVDGAGNAYLTGNTQSTDFPLVNPIQGSFLASGYGAAFVAKINPTGNALVYSTYLGGSGSQFGIAIAVDGAGGTYVAGETTSRDFPVLNPFQGTFGGGSWDGFITKVNPAGSALVYSTYLGGSGDEQPQGIAVDGASNVYVIGTTSSINFPTAAPIFGSYMGDVDAFLTKINASGSALVYSTYLGGSGSDSPTGIAVDASGNAYLSGYTTSTDFPTVTPLQMAYGGNTDAFVTKVNAAGSALVYSTYLGGSGTETLGYPNSIAVDSLGNAYIAGTTYSTDFPVVSPTQAANAGSGDAFVAKLNAAGSALMYSSYLGGTGSEDLGGAGAEVGVDSAGNIYVYGSTHSTDFPTANPLQVASAGGWDSFVTKISSAASLSKKSLTFAKAVVGTTSPAQTVTLVNAGSLAMTINSITSSDPGEFSPAGCGGTLPAGGSCDISVIFKPSTSGVRVARISINDSELNSPQAFGVGGTGTDISLTPARLAFASRPVGTVSPVATVTLTNVGSSQVNFTSISIAGADPMDFPMTDFPGRNKCGPTIASGASCTIGVRFSPTATGPRAATLTVVDSDGGSPQNVALSGTGT